MPSGRLFLPERTPQERASLLHVEHIIGFMTFWSAYLANQERELGAVCPGWFADLVVWKENPLLFRILSTHWSVIAREIDNPPPGQGTLSMTSIMS